MSTLAAIALTLVGVGLLYFRWCRYPPSQGWWTAVGWLLLALAAPAWALGHSTEFAVVYAILVPGVIAWAFVSRQWLLSLNPQGSAAGESRKPNSAKQEPIKPDSRKAQTGHQPASALSSQLIQLFQLDRSKAWLMLVLRTVLVIPYAGAVSLLATIALADLLPWIKNDTLALALLGASLVWGGVVSWLLAQQSLARPVVVLTVIGLLSALYLYG